MALVRIPFIGLTNSRRIFAHWAFSYFGRIALSVTFVSLASKDWQTRAG